MHDKDDSQEIKKLYELVALHELPHIKWIYKCTRQITILVWILLLLILASLVVNAITIALLIDTSK